MPERVLSDEETRKLGLNKPERALSDDEVKQLGLDKPSPERVAGPYGWEDPTKKGTFTDPHLVDRLAAKQETDNANMFGMLSSAAHGAAHAMEGPINGVIAAAKVPPINEKGPTGWDDLVAAYRKERDSVEASNAPNLKDFPHAPIVGSVLAGLPGSAPSALGRIGSGMIQGGVYGLGSSKADLTKGELKQGGKDALVGGLIGGGGAVVGEALQIPGRALARRAQGISDATYAADQAAEAEARAAAVASTTGKEGAATSSAMKSWDRLEDAMFNPAASEETKAFARKFIQSDEGKALYNQVLKNYADEAPAQMGRLLSAKEARAAANAANKPELIEQAAAATSAAKINDTSGVTNRLVEMARRGAGPAIGTLAGGPLGGIAGSFVAGGMGKPGTIMSNMMRSPSAVIPLTKAAAYGIGAGQNMSRAVSPWAQFLQQEDEGKE